MKTKKNDKMKRLALILTPPPLIIRLVFICMISFTTVVNSYGQLNKILQGMNDNTTLGDVKRRMEPFLDSLKTTMDSVYYYGGAGEFKNYKKFVSMWEPRLGEFGTFGNYFNFFDTYWNNQRDDFKYISTLKWIELGPIGNTNGDGEGIGPVEFITFYDDGTHASAKHMLTGALTGGLFYSNNNGVSWVKTGSDTAWAQSGCSSAVFKSGDYTCWYASTSGNARTGRTGYIGLTGGVMRTVDEGKTWKQIADNEDLGGVWNSISKVICDPNDGNRLFAITALGLYKTDSAHIDSPDWLRVLPYFAYDLEYKPDNPSVLYSSIYDEDCSPDQWKIKKSIDDGETWIDLPSQPEILLEKEIKKNFITIEVSKAQPNLLFCYTRNDTIASVYFIDLNSSNGWTLIDSFGEVEFFGDGHGFGIEQVSKNNPWLNIALSKSTKMRRLNTNTSAVKLDFRARHVDVEDIVFDPYIEDKIWVCTHGGVEVKNGSIEDLSISFQNHSNGLGVAEVERMATSNYYPEKIVTGLYHDNTQYTITPYTYPWKPDWQMIGIGDGMQPLINQHSSNNVLYSGQNGNWHYTPDYFITQTSVDTAYTSTSWTSCGTLNKNNSTIFFRNNFYPNTPHEEVYRSNNYGLPSNGNVFISNFRNFENVTSDTIYIQNLYSPNNNGDYLLANVRKHNTNGDTYILMLTKNANALAQDVIWSKINQPRNAQILGLDFHPMNANIIFVSYPIFDENGVAVDDYVYKIDFTDIISPDFTNITKNLPQIPCSGIDCDNTPYEGIYIATEGGVFYSNTETQQYTNNQWRKVGLGLPNVDANEIQLNLESKTIRVGTFGRGVWEIPIPCFTSENEELIWKETEWTDPNEPHEYDRNLVIKTGATLTINAGVVVKFSQDASLIIEPGAKVSINGATLTNLCEGYHWQGIQVWGNANETQYTINQICHQGTLRINGGTIKNAWNAVTLWKPDDWSTTGGIIVARDAYFINNKRSVEFISYHNFIPNTNELAPNLSSFRKCEFKITDGYFIDSPFNAHITMWDMEGIVARGSKFINENTELINMGTGILALDSKFSAVSYCSADIYPCPDSNVDSCIFKGLYAGIEAATIDIHKPYFVEKAYFNKNSYGIKNTDVDNSTVIFSNFDIGYNKKDCFNCPNAMGYGISMDQASGFAIEENYFKKPTDTDLGDSLIGILINNSNASGEIYRNHFERLKVGNFASGKNFGSDQEWNGLSFLCNSNTSNIYDFYIIGDRDQGIQTYQGNKDIPAGNTFSADWIGVVEYNFYNGAPDPITYYYCSECEDENADLIYNVIEETVTNNNTCPSHYGGGSIVLNSEEKLQREQLFASAFINYTNIETLYNNLKDGGSTEATLADIQYAQPDEMWNLRTKLLGDSPHLTEEVLKKVADKTNVFPESVIFDILAANPEELKKEELIKYLEEKENPLPAYMIDILRQVASGTTYKTVLQLELAKQNRLKTLAAQDIIRSYVNDTVVNYSQIRNWLDNLGGIEADKQIISTYLQEGNIGSAIDLANILPQLYPMSEAELVEYNYYMTLLNQQITLIAEARHQNQRTPEELSVLSEIASISTGDAGVKAKNILEFYYNQHSCLCPQIDSTTAKSQRINQNDFAKILGLSISVKPNPANDWVVFDYTIPVSETSARITITDISGKFTESLEVKGSIGQKLWDVRSLKSGTYLYQIIVRSLTQSGKIVISH